MPIGVHVALLKDGRPRVKVPLHGMVVVRHPLPGLLVTAVAAKQIPLDSSAYSTRKGPELWDCGECQLLLPALASSFFFLLLFVLLSSFSFRRVRMGPAKATPLPGT